MLDRVEALCGPLPDIIALSPTSYLALNLTFVISMHIITQLLGILLIIKYKSV